MTNLQLQSVGLSTNIRIGGEHNIFNSFLPILIVSGSQNHALQTSESRVTENGVGKDWS